MDKRQNKKYVGRPLDIQSALKIIEMRLQNPPESFEKIAKEIGIDIKTVHRRYKSALAKLSTGKV